MSDGGVIRMTGASKIVRNIFVFDWTLSRYHHGHVLSDTGLFCSPEYTMEIDDANTMRVVMLFNPSGCESNISLNIACMFTALQIPFFMGVSVLVKDEFNNSASAYKKLLIDRLEGTYDVVKMIKCEDGTDDYFEKDYKIICHVHLPVMMPNFPSEDRRDKIESLNKKCLDYFEQDFEAGRCSDFTITTACEREIKTHKFILMRNHVFASLIKSNGDDNRLKIEDTSYEALKEVLRFMYSAKVNDIDALCVEIMHAANKYRIDDLKNLCVDHMQKDGINVDNAAEILNLTYEYDLPDLRKKVMQFVKMRAADVVASEKFQSADQSSLAAVIIRAIADA